MSSCTRFHAPSCPLVSFCFLLVPRMRDKSVTRLQGHARQTSTKPTPKNRLATHSSPLARAGQVAEPGHEDQKADHDEGVLGKALQHRAAKASSVQTRSSARGIKARCRPSNRPSAKRTVAPFQARRSQVWSGVAAGGYPPRLAPVRSYPHNGAPGIPTAAILLPLGAQVSTLRR